MTPSEVRQYLARMVKHGWRWPAGVRVQFNDDAERMWIVADEASEALVVKPLPEWIKNLGLAVAEANQAMAAVPDSTMQYTIDNADIEMRVALSVSKGSEVSAGGSFGINAFSVNASYSRSYNFKEEASSLIRIHLNAKPREAATGT